MQNMLADERVTAVVQAVRDIFTINQVNVLGQPGDSTWDSVEMIGHLIDEPDSIYPILRERLARLGYIAFLSQEGKNHILRAAVMEAAPEVRPDAGPLKRVLPAAQTPAVGQAEGTANTPHPQRVWINLVLFLLTIISTMYVGAFYEGVDPRLNLANILRGVPFSFTVMVILGTHEMGHYIVARRHKAAVSLPYFIPLPTMFGTMGAVIVQRSPFEDRKTLFDVGIAGPLAGLIVAMPLLIIGLASSTVQPYNIGENSFFEGNSLFYLAAKYLVHGQLLPFNGQDVYLTPMAFAAWFGLLVTFLNLLPVGQLDGGHVLYALTGRRAWPIARGLSQLMILMGAIGMTGSILHIPVLADNFWGGWLIWGVLTTWMRPQHPPPLNDLSRLDTPRKVLGILAIILFFLLFTRMPFNSKPVLL